MEFEGTHNKEADVIIVGGGPAGLAVALGLSRQMFRTVLFDSGEYRNARSAHMHNLIGFDHEDPEKYRAAARQEIGRRYSTVCFVHRKVISIMKLADGEAECHFQATDEMGVAYKARKVVLATGVQDIFPSLPGYQEAWGSSVFHCLFCHGYEEQGAQHAGVFGAESAILTQLPMAILVARTARQFAKKVTIFTHGEDESAKALQQAGASEKDGIYIETRPIARLEQAADPSGGNGLRVHLAANDGGTESEAIDIRFLAHAPDTRLTNDWAEMLGLGLTSAGTYKLTEGTNESTVRGVFVAGDHALPGKVAQAVSSGVLVAAAVARQLLTPEHC